MNESERSPFDPPASERIANLLHRIDEKYWPRIAAMRLPVYVPPLSPVSPKTPTLLVDLLKEYAQALLTGAADEYEQFRQNPGYISWLPRLTNDVLIRVMDAFKKIDESDKDFSLLFHGLNTQQIATMVRLEIDESVKPYLTRGYGPDYQPETATAKDQEPEPQLPSTDNPVPDVTTSPVRNRGRIDEFIQKMASQGLKINRKDIWSAAGYKDRTEFERFQRGEGRNKSASAAFNRVLNMDRQDFMKIIKKKP
jgi:hypothetical protein